MRLKAKKMMPALMRMQVRSGHTRGALLTDVSHIFVSSGSTFVTNEYSPRRIADTDDLSIFEFGQTVKFDIFFKRLVMAMAEVLE